MPDQFRLDLSVRPGNAHEFDLWRNGMSPLFSMDAASASARSSFSANLTSYQFADVAIGLGRSSAARFERTAPMIARSGRDNIALLVYAEGGCSLDAEGRTSDVHAGDVCFIDLTQRVGLRAADYRSLTLMLPRTMLQPHVADLDGLHGRVLRKHNPLNSMLVGHLRTLFAEAPALNAAEARAAAGGTAALIAALAGASDRGRDTVARFQSYRSLYALRRFIEANLANFELGPELICRQFGISRAKLYRIFEPVGGVSFYIHQRRLTRAHELISDPTGASRRIGSIAAMCGFSNVSVFSRAFRQSFGMAPTELRRAVGADFADLRLTGDGAFGTMSHWLLGLNLAHP